MSITRAIYEFITKLKDVRHDRASFVILLSENYVLLERRGQEW